MPRGLEEKLQRPTCLMPGQSAQERTPSHREEGSQESPPTLSPKFPTTWVPQLLPEAPKGLEFKIKPKFHLPSLGFSRLANKNGESSISSKAEWKQQQSLSPHLKELC